MAATQVTQTALKSTAGTTEATVLAQVVNDGSGGGSALAGTGAT